jgi:DNA-binding GntR family transcriptional regulator
MNPIGPHAASPLESALGATLTQISRSRTLGDEAYEQLRHALRSGQLRPGQPITVRGLARALGISLTPAREAMGRLSAEGVLAEGPNRTVLVRRLTQRDYQELMTIRLALEPIAAAHAVEHVSQADLSELQALQDELREAHADCDYKHVLRCNENFHFLLYRKSGMPTLVQLLEGLWLRIGPTLRFLHESTFAADSWPGDTNHRDILAALARRDTGQVAQAVRKDLEDGSARLLAVLARSEPPLD